MDAIYTYRHYAQDRRPRVQFPQRTGRQTNYRQWLAYQYGLHHDGDLPAAGNDQPIAPAFVNHGRWLWQCPGCLTAVQVAERGAADPSPLASPVCCPACFGQAFVQPQFPAERAQIEAELLRQPGYRWNAPFRNWQPGWSLDDLRARTARAQERIAQGASFVRAASIGTPRTWAVGEVLTAANMNTYVREIQKDLIGSNGPIELLDGARPGSFTTGQIAAKSGVADGTQFYNSTTQRLEYIVGGARRSSYGAHLSPLFAAGQVVTVQHNLGFAPRSFQLMYQRVARSAQHGHNNGAQVYVAATDNAPGWSVFDVTSASYKVAMTAAKETVIWALTDASSADNIWKIRAASASNLAGGFGDQGRLSRSLLSPRSLVHFDGALWTINSSYTPTLWKLDPADPDRTDGGFGNQGRLPGGSTDLKGLFVWDNALWATEANGRKVSKIDHTNPGNRSGGFWGRATLAAGVLYMTQFDGAVWGLRTAGQPATLYKFDPSDWDSRSGGFGLQGSTPSGLRSVAGLAAHGGALWTISNSDKAVWKIDPTNPSNENGGFGRQEVIIRTLPAVQGIEALAGDDIHTGYITAASGADAGFPVEIAVDNDAAGGGWGARMLAFA